MKEGNQDRSTSKQSGGRVGETKRSKERRRWMQSGEQRQSVFRQTRDDSWSLGASVGGKNTATLNFGGLLLGLTDGYSIFLQPRA